MTGQADIQQIYYINIGLFFVKPRKKIAKLNKILSNFTKHLTFMSKCGSILLTDRIVGINRTKGYIMFSKLKHRFGAKSKKAVALLAMAALLCGFTGCGESETNSTAISSSSMTSDDKPLNSVTVSTSFDLTTVAKAVPTIKIGDETITLPIKCKDLKHIHGDKLVMPMDNQIGATGLFYDDERIGQLFIEDYVEDYEKEDEYSANNIIRLNLYDYWGSGAVQIDYMGLSFQSSKDDVIKTLGEPDETRDDGYDSLYLVYSLDGFNGGSVTIIFRNNEISEIEISCIAF